MSGNSVAVVGAGLSGLTAAHYLKKHGMNPVIFEADAYPGGRMYSQRHGDFIFDLGTIAITGGTDILPELVRAAGLEADFALAPPLVLGIVKNGEVKRIDTAQPLRDFLATDLLSLASKLKLVKMLGPLLLHRKSFNSESALGLAALDRETINEYAQRELGADSAEYLCSPLIRALWIADASRNSVAQLFWTLRMMAHPLHTLAGGNGSLTEALAKRFDVHYSQVVSRVESIPSGVQLSLRDEDPPRRFDACVVTVPPVVALDMVPEISGAQREFFETINFTKMLAVHFGLSKRPDNSETVLMYPERESSDIGAVYVNHNKAPGRAPASKGSLSAYFTETWSVANFDMADQALIDLAIQRMAPHYPDFEIHIEETRVQRWPLYVMSGAPGIYRLMEKYQLERDARPPARLQFAGDFLPNPGINQAMASGRLAAQRIIGILDQ